MRWLIPFFVSASLLSAATINVVTSGAIGDCTNFYVTTANGSATVVTTNSLGAEAIGKVMLIQSAGALGSVDGAVPITNQDLCVTITGVSGFNVTVSTAASRTTNTFCTFGTNNALVFQNVIASASSGDTITNPPGNYLLIATNLLWTGYTMANASVVNPAMVLSKGGITFRGAGTNNTVFTSCGAWQNKGSFATRGTLMALQGPVSADAPVVIQDITFNGGVQAGRTDYDYFPASVANGNGWDLTHDAILQSGTAPLHQSVTISNCYFTKWRGEVLKGVVPLTDGFVTVTNCGAYDGNASFFNFSFSHNIGGNYIDTFKTAMEFYQGYSTQPSFFNNNRITNIVGITGGGIGIVIGGAEIGHVQPKYTIQGNSISAANSGIFLDPVQNVDILTNVILNCNPGIYFASSGYQGTTNTWGVLIQGNRMTNTYIGISSFGNVAQDAVHNVQIVDNVCKYAGASSQFASGSGWNTNMLFAANVSDGMTFGLFGSSLAGQWFIDDQSNIFPYYESLIWDALNRTVSYNQGMRWKVGTLSGSTWTLDNTSPLKIPMGAQMLFWNASGAIQALVVNSGYTTNVANGMTTIAYWNGLNWQPTQPGLVVGGNLSVGTLIIGP